MQLINKFKIFLYLQKDDINQLLSINKECFQLFLSKIKEYKKDREARANFYKESFDRIEQHKILNKGK